MSEPKLVLPAETFLCDNFNEVGGALLCDLKGIDYFPLVSISYNGNDVKNLNKLTVNFLTSLKKVKPDYTPRAFYSHFIKSKENSIKLDFQSFNGLFSDIL